MAADSSWGVIALVFALVLAAVGWLWLGTVGGITGLFAGALVGTLVTTVGRYRGSRQVFSEPDAPDVRALPPEQALKVLSALAGGGPGGSEVLDALREARARASENPGAALAMVEDLQQRHPRSPAVAAELVRMHRDSGRLDAASSRLTQAITFALDGGMNPAAAALFEEFADLRDRLTLEDRLLGRLERVLKARGADDDAAWCRSRLSAP